MEECDNRKKSDRTLCDECKEKQWKYKCPGCSLRSCSLPCVNSHKKRTECTGKRDRTGFVPLSAFDDNKLLSDYNLLEEMKRAAESAKRMRPPLFPQYRLPHQLQNLKRAASNGRTQIRFLPGGMSKREKNRSYVDKRKKIIQWTIEWKFQHTDTVLIDHEIREDTILLSVIEKHLQPGTCNQKLKQFWKVPIECLKFFIRQNAGVQSSPFIQLDTRLSLKQQLYDTVVVEYPVIYVFLPSHNIDFVVAETKQNFIQRSNVEEEADKNQITGGVAYKVEEIEEDDDISLQKSDAPQSVTPKNERSEKPLEDLASFNAEAVSNWLESDILTQVDYDMDLGLQDAYSSIMAEMNVDDFLNLDAEFDDLAALGSDNNAYISGCDFPIDLEDAETRKDK